MQTMKNSFWLVLILAMGMPTAWGQQTADDPYLFVGMSLGDTHTAYAPVIHRALLVQEGSRLAAQGYEYRVHFGTEQERRDLADARAAAGNPHDANYYHEFTVERTAYLSVSGSRAWNWAPYYLSRPFTRVYWNVNGRWIELRNADGIFGHRVFPGDYRMEVHEDILDPELANDPRLRTGDSWTASYSFSYFEKQRNKYLPRSKLN